MVELRIGLVDVFADRPLTGNPLGVVDGGEQLSDNLDGLYSAGTQPAGDHFHSQGRGRQGGLEIALLHRRGR